MHILVGTSGWSYKEWKGSFCPADLPADDMLRHYATKLPTVEINNSFYRIPREKVLMEWAAQESRPSSVSSSRPRAASPTSIGSPKTTTRLGYFLQTVNVLGDKLGPTLFQCPPSLHNNLDLPRLRDFLARVTRTWRAALEFATTPGSPTRSTTHCRTTTSRSWPWTRTKGPDAVGPHRHWGYFRLRRTVYTTDELRAWADRIGEPGVAGGVRIPQARRGGRRARTPP